MKLKDYLRLMDKLIKENPKANYFEVIFSADAEGNSYEKVFQGPYLAQIHNTKNTYVELVGNKGDDNIADEDLNAICIN